MPTRLTTDDARESLNSHVAARGAEIFERYGPQIGWKELQQILNDSRCTRYPCELVFDSSGLQPGEFAHPFARGEKPEDGFRMQVHPLFMTRLEIVPALVLYQLVLVNYGEFASAEDAETFGARALGFDRESYYLLLCGAADQLASGDGMAGCPVSS